MNENERMNERMNKCNKWKNEWINEWKQHDMHVIQLLVENQTDCNVHDQCLT